MCAVNGNIVTDRDIVAYDDSRFLVEGMEDGAVLDIDVVAETNRVDVAAEDSIEPYRAAVANDGITNDSGVGCEETVVSDLRGEASYRNDVGHDWMIFRI